MWLKMFAFCVTEKQLIRCLIWKYQNKAEEGRSYFCCSCVNEESSILQINNIYHWFILLDGFVSDHLLLKEEGRMVNRLISHCWQQGNASLLTGDPTFLQIWISKTFGSYFTKTWYTDLIGIIIVIYASVESLFCVTLLWIPLIMCVPCRCICLIRWMASYSICCMMCLW